MIPVVLLLKEQNITKRGAQFIVRKCSAYPFISVLLDIGHPIIHVTEAIVVGQIIYYDNPVSAFEEGPGDDMKAFLSGSIPNLAFHLFTFNG